MPKEPVTYSDELAQKICDTVADTPAMLEEICRKNQDFPSAWTIYKWIRTRPDFAQKYARAKDEQIDTLVSYAMDKLRDSSNDFYEDGQKKAINHAALNRLRMEVDYIKWYASKLKRKKYGNEENKGDIRETPFGENALEHEESSTE